MSVESLSTHRNPVELTRETVLPERVADLADEYEAVCGERDRFLWQWIYSLFPSFTLSSVDSEHRDHVRSQKTILTMYVTVLDDLVETHDDRRTFEEARHLVANPAAADHERAAVDEEYFAFIVSLWENFQRGLEDAPRTDEFDDVFTYDLRQAMNAMDYCAVVNDNPTIANLEGAERYDAHNMLMFAYADVDLMYSSGFDRHEHHEVRNLIFDLQEMARIGNWVSTWEREIREGDYTAGIVVLALQEGVVTPSDLRGSDPEAVIETINAQEIEHYFRDRWERRYQAVNDGSFDAESVDLDRLVRGMKTVFEYQTEARGHK